MLELTSHVVILGIPAAGICFLAEQLYLSFQTIVISRCIDPGRIHCASTSLKLAVEQCCCGVEHDVHIGFEYDLHDASTVLCACHS